MPEKKVDKRILHSKRFIKEALLELMQVKNVGRISVLELCRAADVNRNTFYAHYATPEDVLKEIEDELKEQFDDLMSSDACSSVNILRLEKKHKDVMLVLISNPSSDFSNYLLEVSQPLHLKQIRALGIRDEELARKIYLYTYAGAHQLTLDWLQSDCTMPEAETANLMDTMLEGCVKAFL